MSARIIGAMNFSRLACAIALVLAFTASSARAQEQGQIGIAMGYPGAVAVVWHVTDAIAVRPEVSFSGSTYETSASSVLTAATKSSTTTVGVGVSGLIYIGKWDALRTYVSPHYGYNHSSNTSEVTFPFDPSLLASFTSLGLTTSPFALTIPPFTTKTTTSTMTVRGSFGAQYALHEHFSAFGEVGVGYSWLSSTTSVPRTLLPDVIGASTALPDAKNWGTRSAVGVIFYF